MQCYKNRRNEALHVKIIAIENSLYVYKENNENPCLSKDEDTIMQVWELYKSLIKDLIIIIQKESTAKSRITP